MTLALPQAQSIPPSLTLLVGSASGGALLAASSRLLHRKNPEEYLFQVAVPLLALGLASMPLLTAGVPIALPALLACSAYFFGLLWFFVALTDDGIRTGSLAATSLLAFLFGHLAGRVIVEFGPAPLRDAPTISIGLLLMVVFLLVLYIAKYKRYERELVERAERQDFEQTCDNVAQAFGLTQREASVLRLIALGFSTKKVASKLVLSDSTVKTHVRHVYAKLEVHSRDELGDVLRDWANRHPLLERTGKTAISSLNDDMVSPKSTPFDE